MPANDMFTPTITKFEVIVEDLTIFGDPGFRYWIRQHRENGAVETLGVAKLTGLEVDFAGTLVAECHAAWLYGEHGDVLRALGAVVRQAKAHAKLHERGLFQ